MSMITRARSLGRHRGKTPLELRIALDAAETNTVCLTAALDQLGAENTTLEAQLDRAGIDLSGTREDLRVANEEITRLRAELANRDAVTVPPMERDTSNGADQATAPIDVRSLREAADAGLLSPVVRISASGASADPGHVPAA